MARVIAGGVNVFSAVDVSQKSSINDFFNKGTLQILLMYTFFTSYLRNIFLFDSVDKPEHCHRTYTFIFGSGYINLLCRSCFTLTGRLK